MKYIYILSFFSCIFQSCNNCNSKNFNEMPGWRIEYFSGTPVYELAMAVRNDDTEKVKRILEEKNIDVNFKDTNNGCTILMYAIVYSKKKCIEILLKNGADPNISDQKFNENSLILAVKNKGKYTDCDSETIDMLIKYGGDVNSQQRFKYKMNNDGVNEVNTKLINIATQKGCLNIVKLLVQNGAKYRIENDNYTNNVITDGLLQDNLDIVKYFIVKKKINIPNYLFIRPKTKNVDDTYITIEKYLKEREYVGDAKKQKLKDEILKYLSDNPAPHSMIKNN